MGVVSRTTGPIHTPSPSITKRRSRGGIVGHRRLRARRCEDHCRERPGACNDGFPTQHDREQEGGNGVEGQPGRRLSGDEAGTAIKLLQEQFMTIKDEWWP